MKNCAVARSCTAPCGGIPISNPKIFQKLLIENEMTNCNSKCTPYVDNANLCARRPEEENWGISYFQKSVGTLRFIADTTHPAIARILGVLGRLLHDPGTRRISALKSIFRCLSSRLNHGPRYAKKGATRIIMLYRLRRRGRQRRKKIDNGFYGVGLESANSMVFGTASNGEALIKRVMCGTV